MANVIGEQGRRKTDALPQSQTRAKELRRTVFWLGSHALNQWRCGLSLAKMLSGANAFEISDIEEEETEEAATKAIAM